MILAGTVKFTWLLAAVAVAGWLITRRHKQERWFQVVELAAIAGFVLIGLGVIHLPNFQKVLEDAGSKLGSWTYLVVGVLAFAETGAFLGFIAPGETAVIVGGLVAGQGRISLFVLIAIVWACAVLGDVTSYELGRRLGRAWLLRHGERLKITEERLSQVEAFFEKRGGVTILVGRFIGFVRPISPFIAGASKMPFRRFLPYDVLAAGAWSTTFCVLGYVFWRSIDQLTTYVSRGLFAFGTLVVVIAGIVALIRLRRDAETRAKVRGWLDARADRPGWKHVVKLAQPLWRFVGRPAAVIADMTARFSVDRLTPGNLGLELTTLLALLAVGTFNFFLLADVILAPGEPRIDHWAEDVARRLYVDALVSAAKVVTNLGSLAAAIVAVALTGGWALLRRRYVEAAALVAGLALSYGAVHVAKAAYDRRRPYGSYVDAALSSYPSGHACYAVTLVACATVLVRGGVGWAGRVAAVTVAIGVVAVVAITRVYLRAHFLTDVLGGIALGVGIWSLVGVLALFAGRVRHNGGAAP
jgi:membrane protein DedA with SNARE-associated domain/membrane-associated phospholipid phosphatase